MRPPDNKDDTAYHNYLREEGIKIYQNNYIDAKIIVIDRALAIVSSMNFIPSSSSGQSWEAGLVTIDPSVLEEIIDSVLELIERRDSKEI